MYTCAPDCDFKTNRCAGHLLHHVRNGIFTAITADETQMLPDRDNFVDPKLQYVFNMRATSGESLLFLPNQIVERDDWSYGRQQFRIYMFGILPCGSKTCVVLENVPVYMEVRVVDSAQATLNRIRVLMAPKPAEFERYEVVRKYPFHGFSIEPVEYVRIYFKTLFTRKNMIEAINAYNAKLDHMSPMRLQTAEDDIGRGNDYYYPKIAREYRFRSAEWNRLTNYRQDYNLTNCKYTFITDLSGFKKLGKADRAKLSRGMTTALNHDNTLVGSWDIETHRTIQNGQVPCEKDTDFTIINICIAFFWQHSAESLLRVCVLPCDIQDARPHPGISISIYCGNESRLLSAYIDTLGKMQMDILMAYNGGNFDWPLFRVKLEREGKLLDLKRAMNALKNTKDTVENMRWCFRPTTMKINAESRHDIKCVAKFAGVLDIDVMPIFMKMYPSAEIRFAHSLNFFLMKNKLDSKEDLPYKRMFKIYERYVAYRSDPVTRTCHCNTVCTDCRWCRETVPDIDCIPDCIGDNGVDYVYKPDLHPDIVGKCCYHKYLRNCEDIALIGYYCTIDCIRPQQLCVKRIIIMDKRELATGSFTSLYDGIFRADGMRVKNYLGAYCTKLGVAFSNAPSAKLETDKDHYPGAWVFPPVKGLNNRKPTTGLDFNSLYPNIMITYNYSPNMIVYTQEQADKLTALGYTLHRIPSFAYERGAKKGASINTHHTAIGWSVRHNGIMSSQDKQIISGYEKIVTYTQTSADSVDKQSVTAFKYDIGPGFERPVTDHMLAANGTIDDLCIDDAEYQHVRNMRANGTKFTRKVSYVPKYGREALPQERLGVFGMVVYKLFNKRVPIKNELVKLEKIEEIMKKEGLTEYEIDGTVVSHDDIEFTINKINAKQKVIKILTNTFYGESGNYMSPAYEILVSGGTTQSGQYNIKLMANFVVSKQYEVRYGDTDSLYVTCPDTYYRRARNHYLQQLHAADITLDADDCAVFDRTADVDGTRHKLAAALKEAYWNDLVTLTMTIMTYMQEEVYDYLIKDNGHTFLRMAYEEVGFPTVLCGKKKYYMTQHIGTVNFYPEPDKIFVKGIDIVKQGVSGLARELGISFMQESLMPNNEKSLMDIALEKVQEFHTTDWDLSKFVLYARYKPAKKNVPVQTFVSRMRELQLKYRSDDTLRAIYEPPEPGDKFAYVVVEREQEFTLSGKRIQLLKGDKMEYLRTYQESQSGPNPLRIDKDYYLRGSIIGILARYIVYSPNFQPPAGKFDLTDKDQCTQADKYCVAKAGKYLETYSDEFTGKNHGMLKVIGAKKRSVFNQLSKIVRSDAAKKYGAYAQLLDEYNLDESVDDSYTKQMVENMITEAIAPPGSCDQFAAKFIAEWKTIGTIHVLRQTYNGTQGLGRAAVSFCDAGIAATKSELYNSVPRLIKIIMKYRKSFVSLVTDISTTVGSSADSVNNLTPDELESCRQVYDLRLKLRAYNHLRAETLCIMRLIDIERNAQTGLAMTPAALNMSKKVINVPEYLWS